MFQGNFLLLLTEKQKDKHKEKHALYSDNRSVVSTIHKIMTNTDVRITKVYKTY